MCWKAAVNFAPIHSYSARIVNLSGSTLQENDLYPVSWWLAAYLGNYWPVYCYLQLSKVTRALNRVSYSPPLEDCAIFQHSITLLLRGFNYFRSLMTCPLLTWSRCVGCSPISLQFYTLSGRISPAPYATVKSLVLCSTISLGNEWYRWKRIILSSQQFSTNMKTCINYYDVPCDVTQKWIRTRFGIGWSIGKIRRG